MKKKAFILIIVAGLLWGSSGVFVNLLSPYGFSSLQMTAVRGLVAFVCIALYALIFNKRLYIIKPSRIPIYAIIGLCLYVTAALYYRTIQLTNIPTAVVLMYTTPIYVVIFSAIFLKEKVSFSKAGAVGLLVIGCALVSGVVGDFAPSLLGVILGLGSGVVYAAYNVIAKLFISKGDDPASISLYGFSFMALFASFFSKPSDLFPRVAANPVTIPLLICLGIFTFVTPYFLYNLSMKSLSAGTASSLGVIEPLAATIYSIVIFGDIPDVYSIIGIVLVLVAVVLIGVIENKQAE